MWGKIVISLMRDALINIDENFTNEELTTMTFMSIGL